MKRRDEDEGKEEEGEGRGEERMVKGGGDDLLMRHRDRKTLKLVSRMASMMKIWKQGPYDQRCIRLHCSHGLLDCMIALL